MKSSNHSLLKRMIASPFTMIGAIVFIVVMIKAGVNIYEKTSVSSARLSQAQVEFQKLEKRHINLAKRVEYLSTEQGIETEIRTKYHAAKDGESVAVIIDKSKTATVANTLQIQASSTVSWWSRVFSIFGF